MHSDINIHHANDVDTDLVRSTITSHHAAIGTAKVVLQYSKDPKIRNLAEEIIETQKVEIT
ncbi:DUF305 domain-containing protein [Methylorubrum thiocyanatum]|uniref:DUF305 domain-containing protein n=1 Tax=Methylorubrum thiocyanatum TaxID=47958 RepID=UPI0035C82362